MTTTLPTDRQCGRCRAHFPLDADQNPLAKQDWWVCPACHAALFAKTPIAR